MLAFILAYLCIPERFRFIARWLIALFVLAVVVMVVILFARIILTMPMHHGSLLHPKSHQPMSPDFIHYRPHQNVPARRDYAH